MAPSREFDAEYSQFQFRARNHWVDGGINRSTVKDFYAEGREITDRPQTFSMTADEPALLAGKDSAPNPVEFYLHALAGCLTTSLVFHAAVRDIEIASIESQYEGDLDVRGLLGVSEDVTKGYTAVRVKMQVKSDASVEQLTELAMFSPVYDMVSKAVPTELILEKV